MIVNLFFVILRELSCVTHLPPSKQRQLMFRLSSSAASLIVFFAYIEFIIRDERSSLPVNNSFITCSASCSPGNNCHNKPTPDNDEPKDSNISSWPLTRPFVWLLFRLCPGFFFLSLLDDVSVLLTLKITLKCSAFYRILMWFISCHFTTARLATTILYGSQRDPFMQNSVVFPLPTERFTKQSKYDLILMERQQAVLEVRGGTVRVYVVLKPNDKTFLFEIYMFRFRISYEWDEKCWK